MSNIKAEIRRLASGERVSEGLNSTMEGLEVSWLFGSFDGDVLLYAPPVYHTG